MSNNNLCFPVCIFLTYRECNSLSVQWMYSVFTCEIFWVLCNSPSSPLEGSKYALIRLCHEGQSQITPSKVMFLCPGLDLWIVIDSCNLKK